jgi:tetratricopeptide (TPR) repeat protein
LSDHFPSALLEKFLSGELSPDETRSVVAHLVRGCEQCRAAMGPTAELLLDLEAAEQEEAWLGAEDIEDMAGEAAGYDAALDRALAAVRLHGEKTLKRKAKVKRALKLLTEKGLAPLSTRKQGRYPLYEALLRRSWQLRHSDPQEMVSLAWFAVQVAAILGRDGFTTDQVSDFQAQALGELGNALRVADRLPEAEEMLARADSYWKVGTGNPSIALRLLDLRASLLGTQHRYREALELLEKIYGLQLEASDQHGAGRALIKKGIYTGHSGDLQAAVDLLERGASMVQVERDSGLPMVARYNQLWFLVDYGLLEEAASILARHRKGLFKVGERLNRAKLCWVEGRIYGGLGDLERAELMLRKARLDLAAAGAKGHAATVALDLAAVLMHRREYEEVRRLAEEAYTAFCEAKIHDSQAEALLTLREAFEAQIVTAGFLRSVADFLRRAEHNPNARYEPSFE